MSLLCSLARYKRSAICCAFFLVLSNTLAVAAPTAPPPPQNGQNNAQPPPSNTPAPPNSHNTDEPTTLLFLAINEGNVPYVRDAINRGADLDGHNILGQTPLDMAIDLNRNPITFLLLSLRSHKKRTATASTTPVTEQKGTAPISESQKEALLKNLPLAPAQYDTNGTLQMPQRGFLGFDGS